jgi:hypothetical protein
MGTWVKGFLVGLLVSAGYARADGGFHIFTDLQGRSIAAKVFHVDTQRNLVELVLENGRHTKVAPTVFTEADQAYIRDCAIGEAFMASSGLRFSGEKVVIEDWSESGGTGINREFEKVVYKCNFKNGSTVAFDNVEVEYCVFWEQEYPEASGERREELDYSGRHQIDRLDPRAEVEFQTTPVTLVYQYLQGGYYYSNGATGKQSSKMKGVWLKAYLTTASGETYIREFCEPSTVMKYQVWKAPALKEKAANDEPSSQKKKGKKKKKQ